MNNGRKFRIIVFITDSAYAEKACTVISKTNIDFEKEIVTTGHKYLTAQNSINPDIIISYDSNKPMGKC